MDFKSELNEKQYEAVSDSSQYLRIIAGAGSGKTRVLTYRIAYLLNETETKPYEILAITFTNKVANEMKERTLKLVANVSFKDLNISTFHSWCAKFLRYEIHLLQFPSSFLILDEDDALSLVKNIAVEHSYNKSDKIVKEALSYISFHKMKGELPGDIKTDFLSPRQKECLEFFKEYEKKKNESFYLDFDDLMIYSINILSSFKDVRKKYQNQYKHILIDEFQDTNDIQYKIIRLLTNEDTSLYVVGDPDQTIYTWRGANQDIIMNINRDYSPMKTIILNENYRSTSSILSSANKLIAFNKNRVKKDLFTRNEEGQKIQLTCYDNALSEAIGVSKKIKEIIKDDKEASYKDIAILYRSNYLSLKLENALTARGIPYKIYGGTKFYMRQEIKDCLAYFHILINEDDDLSFLRIINSPKRKIGETSIEKIKEEAQKNGLFIIKYLRNIHNYKTEIRAQVIEKLQDLFIEIDKTKVRLNENLEDYSAVLDEFLKNIKYYDYLMNDADRGDEKLENVMALKDDIKTFLKFNPESTFDEYLQNVALLSAQDEISGSDNVTLMTVHTAKGLEFKYVFIIGFAKMVFPNNRALLERPIDGLEEERRLAYVAFTRTKKELFVSYNRGFNTILNQNNLPSQFITEAGLKPSYSSESIYGIKTNNELDGKIYRYDNNNPYAKKSNADENVINISLDNGIVWHEGDICLHKVFGEGVVENVSMDNIITVNFYSYGRKFLQGSHSALSKKSDGKNII